MIATFLLQELLRLMGMSDVVYWVNVVCVGLSIGVPLCVISTIQLTYEAWEPIFIEFTNPLIVFLIFLFFVIGSILIVLLISVICFTGGVLD